MFSFTHIRLSEEDADVLRPVNMFRDSLFFVIAEEPKVWLLNVDSEEGMFNEAGEEDKDEAANSTSLSCALSSKLLLPPLSLESIDSSEASDNPMSSCRGSGSDESRL